MEWVSLVEGRRRVAWWGVISSTNYEQNCILWCLGQWKAISDPILFFFLHCACNLTNLVGKKWCQLPPLSLWVLIICPHHVYTSLTQTRWGNKGWRFRNSHQCMPLNLIICPNNIFSCWREKVFNPNNAHERKKNSPELHLFLASRSIRKINHWQN